MDLPNTIYSGSWHTPHVQGIAVDTARKYIYFAFTTTLVKTDLSGRVIGTVSGLTGHLGCIAFNDRDGRVYGSLEYKSAKAFYAAVFDVEKIDRVGLDAEKDGIMTAVYLPEVVADYTADMDGNGVFDGDRGDTPDHRYGCSGIDGTTFGPALDGSGDDYLLTIAYGIYRNDARTDNDYQVLLQYDWRTFGQYEKPLDQTAHHTSGPEKTAGKYFVFTGNTTYGVQNLEYDPYTKNWFMAVYNGAKEQYPNLPLYVIDGSVRAEKAPVLGQAKPEEGMVLQLLKKGVYHEKSGVWGWRFPLGSTGLIALGDGTYYISQNGRAADGGQDSTVRRYRYDESDLETAPFRLIEE